MSPSLAAEGEVPKRDFPVVPTANKALLRLLQRSGAKDVGARPWECVTGRLEQGESFLQAVRREAFEDLGMEVHIEFVLGTTHFYRDDALPEHAMVGVHYGCSIQDTTRLQLSDEHCTYQWVTAE